MRSLMGDTKTWRREVPVRLRPLLSGKRPAAEHALIACNALFTARWYPDAPWALTSLLRKVFMVDLLTGLKITFRYQDPRKSTPSNIRWSGRKWPSAIGVRRG